MDAQVTRFNRLVLVLAAVLFMLSEVWFGYQNQAAGPGQSFWMVLLNALILALPLALFFGALYLLVTAGYERRVTGRVSPARARIIRWAPRAAAIVIILFISLFSLDVFGSGGSFWQLLGGFLMHNLPSILLIALLVIAWRRPAVGFAAFLLAGVVFLRFLLTGGGLPHFLLFSGPLLLVSALFYADWRWSREEPLPAAAGSAL